MVQPRRARGNFKANVNLILVHDACIEIFHKDTTENGENCVIKS